MGGGQGQQAGPPEMTAQRDRAGGVLCGSLSCVDTTSGKTGAAGLSMGRAEHLVLGGSPAVWRPNYKNVITAAGEAIGDGFPSFHPSLDTEACASSALLHHGAELAAFRGRVHHFQR